MISRRYAKQETIAAIAGLVYLGAWLYTISKSASKYPDFLQEGISDHAEQKAAARTSTSGPLGISYPDSPPAITCQRPCLNRLNKIYYIDGSAGLGDRKAIFRDLAQIAGYLCAELVLPPPSELLHKMHNFDNEVGKNIEWADLYNITFIEDGLPVIQAPSVEFEKYFGSWHDIPVFDTTSNSTKYNQQWLHVISTNGKVRKDFDRIQTFSFRQEAKNPTSTVGFVWEIHDKWFDSDLWKSKLPMLSREVKDAAQDVYRHAMRPYLHRYYTLQQKNHTVPDKLEGCKYTSDDTMPSHVKIMQNRLLKRIIRQHSKDAISGLLHLRRGDSINNCDTSVDKMRDYLACSLNGTESLGRNLTMIFMTDESDTEYRKNIMDLLDEYPHVSIVDGDALTKAVVGEAVRNGLIDKDFLNNFYTYDVESVLRDRHGDLIKFTLEQRKSSCHDCIKFLKKRLQHMIGGSSS